MLSSTRLAGFESPRAVESIARDLGPPGGDDLAQAWMSVRSKSIRRLVVFSADAEEVLDRMDEAGVGARVEPEVISLLRLCVRVAKSGSRDEIAVRVVLGAERGIALTTLRDVPLSCEVFELPTDAEIDAVVSMIRRIGDAIDGLRPSLLLLHGRSDLMTAERRSALEAGARMRSAWHAVPNWEPAAVAKGAALFRPDDMYVAFNLAKRFGPEATLAETLPWRQTAAQILLAALFTGAVVSRGWGSPLPPTPASIPSAKDRDALREEVTASAKVAADWRNRSRWSPEIAALAEILPEGVSLTEISAFESAPANRSTAANGAGLVVRGVAPIGADGGQPRELRRLLALIKGQRLFDKYRVDLHVATANSSGNASFVLHCTQRSSGVATK